MNGSTSAEVVEDMDEKTLDEIQLNHERPTMLSCVVYGCNNNSITSDSSIMYHPFPKNDLAQQWAEACGWQSNTLDLETACICSIHFPRTAYNPEIKMDEFVACYASTLRSDAVPTLYLPQTQILVKDNLLKLDSGLVVYTINSGSSEDGVTISLEDGAGGNQIFELQPEVKEETEPCPVESETFDQGNDEAYPDVDVIRAHNERLRRKLETLERDVQMLQKNLSEKEKRYKKYEKEYKNLKTQIGNDTLSTQEQKSLLSKVFSDAQIKILLGKKKVYWSNDDMAVGYIIRHLSNKRCYGYLTKTLNIPLPGISSIKRWVTEKKAKRIRN